MLGRPQQPDPSQRPKEHLTGYRGCFPKNNAVVQLLWPAIVELATAFPDRSLALTR
ncbi:hypothetical protein [Frankia tisae]|uniref:hypothetical protein n=1 Tax=Frankia tisae TaxID=2950104 RepID=UPI0021C250F8|nr:hypothetical protein [Frankia tisae]